MNEKCVIVVNREFSAGEKANAAAILGASLGKERPDLIGPDVNHPDGKNLNGIITIPIAVLQADPEKMDLLCSQTSFIFTDIAQHSVTYDDYTVNQARNEGIPVGLLLIGPEKKIRKLTGDLPLMRG